MRPTKFLSLSWLFFSHSYVTDFLHYLFPTDLLQWHKKVVFFKQFVRWTLLLSVKYLLFNCWIYLQKKTYCKNHEKNLFWWWKWAITFLFTIFRIWSLRIDRSIWSIHLFSIAVALLIDSNDIDFLMFHVKCTSFIEVVKSHTAFANSKMLN